jgi:hypothetical protein
MPYEDADMDQHANSNPDIRLDFNTRTIGYGLKYDHFHGFTCSDRDCTGRHSFADDDHRDGGGDEDRADRRTGHGIGRLPENYVPLICIVVTALIVAPMFLALGFMLATRKM